MRSALVLLIGIFTGTAPANDSAVNGDVPAFYVSPHPKPARNRGPRISTKTPVGVRSGRQPDSLPVAPAESIPELAPAAPAESVADPAVLSPLEVPQAVEAPPVAAPPTAETLPSFEP